MKKAKIILTALSILAVTGGTLALKAKRFESYSPVFCRVGGYCTFTSFQTEIETGVPTTTAPCGSNVAYYTGYNCPAYDAFSPTLTRVLYETNPE